MKEIINIFISDLKRILRRPVAAVILGGLLIIPGIYAWLNIDSNWDPYANTGKLPIAIVNKDKGTTILGDELHMGDEVVNSLKDNKDMKWIFTTDELAKGEVESSHYYGEIVIPENFSTKLISVFNTKKIERPQFDFYVNHKKNPIAPIIVNKAVTAIQNAINQNIINAIIYKTLNTAENMGLVTKAARTTDELIDRLNNAKRGIESLRAVLKTVASTADLTCKSLNAFKELLPTVEEISGTTKDGVYDIQNALSSFKDLSDDVDSGISSIENDVDEITGIIDSLDETHQENMDNLSDKMDDISKKLQEKHDRIQRFQYTLSRISQLVNLSNYDRLQGKLQDVTDSIYDAQNSIQNTRNNISDARSNIQDVKSKLRAVRHEQVNATRMYRQTIKGDLDSAYDNTSKSMDSVTKLMSGISEANQRTGRALDSMNGAIEDSKELTENIDVVLGNLIPEIDKVINFISGEKESEMYNKFVNLVENDPVDVANFLSTPVKTNEIDLYNINTYGSKMAPFYTVLASWVGCTLLISILKTDIESDDMKKKRLTYLIKDIGHNITLKKPPMTYKNLENDGLYKNSGDDGLYKTSENNDTESRQIPLIYTTDYGDGDDDNVDKKKTSMINTLVDAGIDEDMRNEGMKGKAVSIANTDVASDISTKAVAIENSDINGEEMEEIEDDDDIRSRRALTIVNNFDDSEMYMRAKAVSIINTDIENEELRAKALSIINTDCGSGTGSGNGNGNMNGGYGSYGTDGTNEYNEYIRKRDELKNYQKFLGRFLLFGCMAMIQGLVIGIGDILLKVQVINIPLFLLTIVISSLVFMLFIFSLTVSFGKVGEALTIVIMVLQVAGSGGTYPIELLPRAFAVLQPIMPFYPAMNVLRETIGGFYKNYYIYYMCMLLMHTIIPLLLGLIFRNPVIHLKEKLDRELERTGIII